ncbi:hypothetical protein AB4876_09495 [Zhongshania guokunii]|uniref:Phage tail tube protein n=1 Tax=Zhongshania guokunii TaxID=641783 RepID=A0ABV3U6R1_9GAMM
MEFAQGYTFKVGDGEEPEVFTAMALMEVPDLDGSEAAQIADRTTADTGNTKKYRLGFEDGETIALKVKKDYEDAAQDLLRAAHRAKTPINCQHVLTDGTVTETYEAPYLVVSAPTTVTDPNGDGDLNMQTFNIKRNDDHDVTESSS